MEAVVFGFLLFLRLGILEIVQLLRCCRVRTWGEPTNGRARFPPSLRDRTVGVRRRPPADAELKLA
jgi:hypothetical protein